MSIFRSWDVQVFGFRVSGLTWGVGVRGLGYDTLNPKP